MHKSLVRHYLLSKKEKAMNKVISSSALLVFVSVCTQSTLAALCVQRHNTIGMVGLDSGQSGVVYASVSNHDDACGCNDYRFKPENTDTKSALSILLSAKVSGQAVRVDVQDSNDCNTAFRVYLE